MKLLVFIFLVAIIHVTASSAKFNSLSTPRSSSKLIPKRHTKLLQERLSTQDIKFMERSIPRSSFIKTSLSDPSKEHEVTIALKQNNLDLLEAELLARSSPSHPLYQQWMKFDEITNMTQNLEAYEAVTSWIEDNGLRITYQSARQDYISVLATISQWEDLLTTTFYTYEDHSVPKALEIRAKGLKQTLAEEQKKPILYQRAEEYYLPNHLTSHISAIFETVQIPPEYKPHFYMPLDEFQPNEIFNTYLRKNLNSLNNFSGTSGLFGGSSSSHSFDASEPSTSSNFSPQSFQTQSSTVTIDFLNSLYKINNNNASNPLNSQGIFSTSNEYFSTNDLIRFQNRNNIANFPATAKSHSSAECTVGMSCAEGNLDMQYIMGMAQEITSYYWYVPSNTKTDPFLMWIKQVSESSSPPLSNSISWGINEYFESASFMKSFNNEALKLSALGVSIVVATGDDGVANKIAAENGNVECLCNYDSSSTEFQWTSDQSWEGAGFFPNFPASSPYVTAVGATQGPENGQEEIACSSKTGGVITTGGGFSAYFPRPSYQNSTISNYFSNYRKISYTEGYNPNGRGYPDISLIGVAYEVIISSKLSLMYGTSASAPVLAAFISLVNTLRFESNLTSIGFINPTLYEIGYNNTMELNNIYNISINFNDVTEGNNYCCAAKNNPVCCSNGFDSTPGWDPVTGWGSMDFTQFSALFSVATTYVPPPQTNSNSGNDAVQVIGIAIGIVAAIALVGLILKAAYNSCCGMNNSAMSASQD